MAQSPLLDATFVRTAGERDRIYVTRADASTVSWAMASYGEALPHDLVHLVVESAFGVGQGFWGRVNAGVDPGAIAREANRKGGPDKYAAFGPDQATLHLAEGLANLRFLAAEQTVEALAEQAQAVYREFAIEPPAAVGVERIERLRGTLAELTRRWRDLSGKGALTLAFDPADPARGFARLLNHALA